MNYWVEDGFNGVQRMRRGEEEGRRVDNPRCRVDQRRRGERNQRDLNAGTVSGTVGADGRARRTTARGRRRRSRRRLQ